MPLGIRDIAAAIFGGMETMWNRTRKGTVFKLTPSGVLTTLHSFSGTDGASPMANLIEGSDGNFYSTTYAYGAEGDGTVFQITPSGVLTTLYSFGGTDGANPLLP